MIILKNLLGIWLFSSFFIKILDIFITNISNDKVISSFADSITIGELIIWFLSLPMQIFIMIFSIPIKGRKK